MYELARLARVIYATGREDIRDVLKAAAIGRKNAAAPFAPPLGLKVVEPLWPRTYRYRTLDNFLFKAYIRRLQGRLDADAASHRVVYAWNPACLETVKALSYDLLIYHPYDMFRHFFNAPEDLAQKEDELCRIADMVLTPHGQIAAALGHPSTHVVGNGVFLPAFPVAYESALPEALKSIKKPIIGNLGVINDKIDFHLLLEVFSRRQEWQLVLIGAEGEGAWRTSSAYAQLKALENVHIVGGVPINKVAQFIAGFDVGIIPYSVSGWAKFIESPLKLYQYWAMGVPVVSSALPTLQSIPGALEVCSSVADWVAAVETQLTQRGSKARKALRGMAEQHSWTGKAERVIDVIRHRG